MRFIFVEELIKYARKNKNAHLVTSDLGYRAFEEFAKIFPQRFLNVGVSENNMIGVAAGMAMSGKKVFVYSILPFVLFVLASMRVMSPIVCRYLFFCYYTQCLI